MTNRVLAFDFGASSGRAVICELRGKKVELKEVHRFSNDPVSIHGVFYWDVLRLFHEIKQGILAAKDAGGFDSIGIDTWGVDYGLLDKCGNLLRNPVHYRDERTVGMIEKLDGVIPRKDMYLTCGLQFMRFNTLYQLAYDFSNSPEIMAQTDKILLMADLFMYFLTGEKHAEFSNASTTQILDQTNDTWNKKLLKAVGINSDILPNIIHSGDIYGYLKEDIAKELGVERVPIVAVATHDTASAVVAVPQPEKEFAFISCGTWSLFGTENDSVVINEDTYNAKFTNERGINKTTRLLKNIMGLWIIQECKRQWAREGRNISFSEIVEESNRAEGFKCFIDVDDARFETAGDMPSRIAKYCEETGQYVPRGVGEIARCVYESLAFKYRNILEQLESVTKKSYDVVNIVGGGVNAKILCQYASNAMNRRVEAGPSEGTALGNAMVQFISCGAVEDLKEARQIVKASVDIAAYEPEQMSVWNEKYTCYKKACRL